MSGPTVGRGGVSELDESSSRRSPSGPVVEELVNRSIRPGASVLIVGLCDVRWIVNAVALGCEVTWLLRGERDATKADERTPASVTVIWGDVRALPDVQFDCVLALDGIEALRGVPAEPLIEMDLLSVLRDRAADDGLCLVGIENDLCPARGRRSPMVVDDRIGGTITSDPTESGRSYHRLKQMVGADRIWTAYATFERPRALVSESLPLSAMTQFCSHDVSLSPMFVRQCHSHGVLEAMAAGWLVMLEGTPDPGIAAIVESDGRPVVVGRDALDEFEQYGIVDVSTVRLNRATSLGATLHDACLVHDTNTLVSHATGLCELVQREISSGEVRHDYSVWNIAVGDQLDLIDRAPVPNTDLAASVGELAFESLVAFFESMFELGVEIPWPAVSDPHGIARDLCIASGCRAPDLTTRSLTQQQPLSSENAPYERTIELLNDRLRWAQATINRLQRQQVALGNGDVPVGDESDAVELAHQLHELKSSTPVRVLQKAQRVRRQVRQSIRQLVR